MKAVEIKKGVYWVGAIDWDLRDFHGYTTNRGSSYNAYLIVDEKIVLVDTVKHYLYDEMLSRVRSVVDPSKIDYIVSNHVEMDHSGALPMIIKEAPRAAVLTSPNGEKGLKKHYGEIPNIRVVSTGDKIAIGKRTLVFELLQMVHWPDSMATYIPEDKLLLPNDAFGQHIASSERFDEEVGWDIVREEAAKYYANIVLCYGKQVQSVLGSVLKLDIDMIAPSHGIIWRKNIPGIVECYKKWSANICDNKAVIVYDTMWGSTGKMAYAIQEALDEKGVPSTLINLKNSDISDIMTKLLEAKYIFVGSPTLNNGMLPSVAGFLTYMKGLAPKNRSAMAFGSYGWGGQSVDNVQKVLEESGFSILEKQRIMYIPSKEDLNDLKGKIKGVVS